MHHEKSEFDLQELIIINFMCAYNSSILVEKCKTKQENLTSSTNIKERHGLFSRFRLNKDVRFSFFTF